MLAKLKCPLNLSLCIAVVLISIGAQGASIKKNGHFLIKSNSKNSVVLNIQKNITTIHEKSRSLTILPHAPGKSRFYYSIDSQKKNYLVAGVIDNTNNQILKIGYLTYSKKVRNNLNECNPKINTDSLSKIASIPPTVFTQDHIQDDCKSILKRNSLDDLEERFTNFFDPKQSFLLKCLNNSQNASTIDKKTSLSIDANNFLAKYYQEQQQLMEGKPGFKVSCVVDDNAKYSAKYDEQKKEIVFPVSNKELKKSSSCDNPEYNITHEFAHHSGIKTEAVIDEILSICANNSKDGNSDFNKCFTKDKNKETDKFALDSIKQEITEAVSSETTKERTDLQQKLQQNPPAKVEIVSAKESIELSTLADNSKYTDYNEAPKAEAQKIEQKLEPIAVKMEQNLANVSRSVDSALGIASETAYADTELAASSRGTYTTSSYAGTGSSSSGSDSSFSKREAGSANIRTTSNRNPASFSKLKMSGNAQEYVVEEILADKYGLSKSEVQKISTDLRSRTSRGINSATNIATNSSNEIAGSNGAEGSLPSPAVGAAGGSAGIGSLGGGVNTRQAAARTRNNQTRGGSSRSPSSSPSPVSGDEVVGLDYRNVKTKYRDQEFVREITESNIRILIPSLKKRIGSTEKDATIYVDTGTSLLRKK